MTETPAPDALKPCPFCGGKAKTSTSVFGGAGLRRELCGVHCDGDCLTFFDCRADTEAEAITAWNTRHEATRELVEEITRLRAENERLREVLLWLNQNVSGYGADHIICHTCVEVENLARTALQETGGE